MEATPAEAALAIQRIWRAHAARTEVKEMERAARTVQRTFRTEQEHKKKKNEAKRAALRSARAAERRRTRRVQAMQREYRTLDALSASQAMQHIVNRQESMVVRIQAWWRGHIARKQIAKDGRTKDALFTSALTPEEVDAAKTIHRAIKERMLKAQTAQVAAGHPDVKFLRNSSLFGSEAVAKRKEELQRRIVDDLSIALIESWSSPPSRSRAVRGPSAVDGDGDGVEEEGGPTESGAGGGLGSGEGEGEGSSASDHASIGERGDNTGSDAGGDEGGQPSSSTPLWSVADLEQRHMVVAKKLVGQQRLDVVDAAARVRRAHIARNIELTLRQLEEPLDLAAIDMSYLQDVPLGQFVDGDVPQAVAGSRAQRRVERLKEKYPPPASEVERRHANEAYLGDLHHIETITPSVVYRASLESREYDHAPIMQPSHLIDHEIRVKSRILDSMQPPAGKEMGEGQAEDDADGYHDAKGKLRQQQQEEEDTAKRVDSDGAESDNDLLLAESALHRVLQRKEASGLSPRS